MQETITLRSRVAIALTVVMWIICAGGVITLAVTQPLGDVLRYCWGFLLLGYGTWLLFWSPSVTIAPPFVTVRNLIREFEVTWPSIQRIDTKFALTLYTTGGRVTAWSAPAPSRHAAGRTTSGEFRGLPESTFSSGSVAIGDIPGSESGLAALYVRRRWEQLRDSGALDAGVEGTGLRSRWLWGRAAIAAALIALTVVGILL